MANQINIAVGANIKDLQEGLKLAVSTMEKSGNDMNAVGKSIERMTSKSFADVGQAVRSTTKDLYIIGSTLGTSNEVFEHGSALLKEYSNQYANLKSKIEAVNNLPVANSLKAEPVQKAAQKFNMLGNSINQITRELPAFTYSMQTGFMAISNNLPIFFDEISRIQTANKALAASGQPVQSMFSQLSGAIFSVGTALSLGVTALTMYGPALFEVISATEDATKANEALAASVKAIESAETKVLDIVKETSKLRVQAMKEGLEKQKEEATNSYKQGLRDLFIAREKEEIAEFTYQQRKIYLWNIYQNKLTEIADKAQSDRNKKNLAAQKAMEEGLNYKGQIKKLKELYVDVERLPLPKIGKIDLSQFLNVQGEFSKLGVFFDELGAKIGGWANMATNAIMGFAVSFGEALATGDFKSAGEAIVKQLGNIAIQIGAAMVAIGIPQVAAGLPSGFAYIAGGTALGIIGGVMMASGRAPGSSGSDSASSGGSFSPSEPMFNPTFGGGSQYLMLSSTVRGTDIIISADNQRRQNRRIR